MLRFVAAFALLAAAGVATAAYPDRPVRFVVPVAPGGAVDVVGRIVAQKLSGVMGPVAMSPEDFEKFIKADIQKYAEIVKKAGIQPQ